VNDDESGEVEKYGRRITGLSASLPAGDIHFQRAWLNLSTAVTAAGDDDFAQMVIAEVERRAIAVRMGVVPAMQSVWDDIRERRLVPKRS
jgi:hypothetical protein